MSNFKNVSELNTLWGNLKGDPKNPDWEKLKNQAMNIKDEYDELMEAIEAEDITELRDAVCDILVFTYGLGHMAGVPVDQDMDEVDSSNRSKFCKTPEEVESTFKYYNNLGLKVIAEGEYPMVVVRSYCYQVGLDNKVYQDNKVLKCVKWKKPSFKPL